MLGPLLFLISINDLPESIQAKTLLYADDTTFLNSSPDINALRAITQNVIKDVAVWFSANGFLLNDSKTQQIVFSVKKNNPQVYNPDHLDAVKFLGVFFDSRLSWSQHIDFIAPRLARVIYLLGRLTFNVPESYLKTAYFAYFQSIIRYGLVLWGNCSRVKEVLVLQKKAIRVITNSELDAHCKPLFIKLKLQTVINLYIFDLICYAIKDKDNFKYNYDKHSYSTRNKDNVSIEYARLSKTCNSYPVVSLKIFNKLKKLFDKFSENQFKNKFYDWLLLNPFYSLNEFFDCTVEF